MEISNKMYKKGLFWALCISNILNQGPQKRRYPPSKNNELSHWILPDVLADSRCPDNVDFQLRLPVIRFFNKLSIFHLDHSVCSRRDGGSSTDPDTVSRNYSSLGLQCNVMGQNKGYHNTVSEPTGRFTETYATTCEMRMPQGSRISCISPQNNVVWKSFSHYCASLWIDTYTQLHLLLKKMQLDVEVSPPAIVINLNQYYKLVNIWRKLAYIRIIF